MITRERVQELLDKYVTTEWLKLHMRESEVIMRRLAKHLGEDEELWGLSGLLHDIDYDYVNKDPDRHVVEFDKILEMEGIKIGEEIPEEMYHAIKAHYEENPAIEQKRESKLDYALSAAENLSGFLVACALVQPDKKISSVRVDSVLKKFKKKDFAKTVNRDLIYDIEKTGLSLEEFVKISLESIDEISDEIGL
ncbi:MAG: metal dependent phosphohydrolase [candidate division WS6 bacterium 36_33]|uniref:Metal dependent phosphohydrolase n=1 Tax=candidate division WS6 bacterium 36_33 TaxID=1641388 RepID=A0A117LU73_9BACT|nr:MAG: metal dependent phosphohydrolase [candidate division WS6 bacterium 36_33]